jgi:tRNA-Thr(GGU) m(6)t(6)A37 methyltransferase TsaA
MADRSSDIICDPIGRVKNGVRQTPERPDWQLETVSELVVERKWEEGLEGLEGFSHIMVVFWFDRITETNVALKVHPMHRIDLPLTGLFATRAPNRPNRIGVTVVRLVERNGNVLKVKGLDALDGTPILDVKPYLRSGDLVCDAIEPPWTTEDHA